jgi:hypothetical protein
MGITYVPVGFCAFGWRGLVNGKVFDVLQVHQDMLSLSALHRVLQHRSHTCKKPCNSR